MHAPRSFERSSRITAPGPPAPLPDREWHLYAAIALVYALLRLLLIPADAELTRAFSHDSGYLALVAGNLAAGRGYVHDALWLVFLLPPELPMAYHNANPLFPTVTAGMARLTGDVFFSGFAVTALASVALFCATIALLRPVVRTPLQAAGLAAAVTLFPPVLVDSFFYLTDALCAALLIGFLAVITRTTTLGAFAGGGVLLGLAWLTRGASIVVVPALAVYLLLRYRPRAAMMRLAVVGLGALVVAAPWLIHTKRVWGSYLRSDSGYAMVQDLAARKLHQNSVVRFWHSPEKPPSVTSFIRESPSGFARHVAAGTVNVTKRSLSWWSMRRVPVALVLLGGVLVLALERRRWWSPEAAGLVVFGTTTVLMLAVRGESFEERYVNTLTVLIVTCAVAGCWRAWQLGGRPARTIVVAGAAVWVLAVPVEVADAYSRVYGTDPAQVAYRKAALEVDQKYARGGPVVVGMAPYFYSIATGTPALNFPDASDEFLLEYMDRYRASFIYLTADELEFWRPSWTSGSGLPDALRLSGRLGDGFVFERSRVPLAATLEGTGR